MRSQSRDVSLMKPIIKTQLFYKVRKYRSFGTVSGVSWVVPHPELAKAQFKKRVQYSLSGSSHQPGSPRWRVLERGSFWSVSLSFGKTVGVASVSANVRKILIW